MKELDSIKFVVAIGLLTIGFLVFKSKRFSYLYGDEVERLIISKLKRNTSNLLLSTLLYFSIGFLLFSFSYFDMNFVLLKVVSIILLLTSILLLSFLWFSYYNKTFQTPLREKILEYKSYLFSAMLLIFVYFSGLSIFKIEARSIPLLDIDEGLRLLITKLIASFIVAFSILMVFKIIVVISRMYEESVCINLEGELYEFVEIINSEKVELKKVDEKIYRIIDIEDFYDHELMKMAPVNNYSLY